MSIYLKEEAYDLLEQDSVRDLIKNYSQFINFNIYCGALSQRPWRSLLRMKRKNR